MTGTGEKVVRWQRMEDGSVHWEASDLGSGDYDDDWDTVIASFERDGWKVIEVNFAEIRKQEGDRC